VIGTTNGSNAVVTIRRPSTAARQLTFDHIGHIGLLALASPERFVEEREDPAFAGRLATADGGHLCDKLRVCATLAPGVERFITYQDRARGTQLPPQQAGLPDAVALADCLPDPCRRQDPLAPEGSLVEHHLPNLRKVEGVDLQTGLRVRVAGGVAKP